MAQVACSVPSPYTTQKKFPKQNIRCALVRIKIGVLETVNDIRKKLALRPYMRIDWKYGLVNSETCRKQKEWVLKIKAHAEDMTATLFKNLDIHMYV